VTFPDVFHARGSARGKRYRYVLWVDETPPPELDRRVWTVRGPLDVDAMQRAMAVLVGRHDFATFASKSRIKRRSTERTITRAELTVDVPRIELAFEGDGFLYKMVRNLVRAVVKVGEGRHAPRDIERLLAARDRKAAPGTAPASGLYLDAVVYDPPLFAS
jgi:tRNA pseudouridine38-40 synthase